MSRASAGSSGEGGLNALGPSPGPIYYPSMKGFGSGPKGKGSEFSIRPSHRFSRDEMRTTQAERPGPKYMLPPALGVQWESTKRSFQGGKISQCPRKTVDTNLLPGRESPGPAAYNRGALGLRTEARRAPAGWNGKNTLTTGMGGAQRFFDSETRTGAVPGPGHYPLPTAIGGKALPHKKAYPVYAFSKGQRDFVYATGEAPGPIYKLRSQLGTQVSSQRPSSAKFGFGTGSRFPLNPEENRQHLDVLRRVAKQRANAATRPKTAGAATRSASEGTIS